MKKLKYLGFVLSLIVISGLSHQIQAQATNTIVYKLDGQQVSTGVADATTGTNYVTYAGSVGGPGSKGFKLKSFNLTLVYEASGLVVDGQWSLLAFREGVPRTLNGPITPVTLLQLNRSNAVASGTYLVTFGAGDPTWEVTGLFTMAVDNNSRPPKISGPLALTFPVVQ